MTKCIYGIFGASGFGREVMPIARTTLASIGMPTGNLFFVDDSPGSRDLNGHYVLSYSDFVKMEGDEKYISIAIADSETRKQLTERCISDGLTIWSLQAGNAVVMDEVTIAEGSILSPFITLTSNISIGKSFHANIYSYVAHDCIIGDYVTFAPSVKCNGNVVIEDYAYIGTGVVIRQGDVGNPLIIGSGAVVGMGAVVTKNVPEGAVVIGNPAKPLVRK